MKSAFFLSKWNLLQFLVKSTSPFISGQILFMKAAMLCNDKNVRMRGRLLILQYNITYYDILIVDILTVSLYIFIHL